jgi:hypothetical protein
VKVPVLTVAVSVIVVLRVAFRVVDVAGRAVVELIEGGVAGQNLADDVVAGLGQHTVAFHDLAGGRRHGRQLFAAQRVMPLHQRVLFHLDS